MKVVCIRPGLWAKATSPLLSFTHQEPLALAILAGLTPNHVDFSAVDDRFEPIPYEVPWDLVALSVGTFEARRAYAIADEFRRRGRRVVMGGFHPTFCPDEALEHADAVAIGQAEGTWTAILADAADGVLKPRYECPEQVSLDGVLPNRHVFAGKRYAPISVVQSVRGCRFACDFCAIQAFYRNRLYRRPVADVLSELRAAGRRRVFFADDNLIADRDAAKELLIAIRPLGLKWTTQISIDVVDDPALMDLLVTSGCQSVVIGLESLHEDNLGQMRKGWSRVSEYGDRLAALRQRGIMVYGTFVFGYDHDTLDSVTTTLEFALRHKLFLANFNHLLPYPGTPLYRRLEESGRLRYPKWWLDPRYHWGDVAFIPKNMAPDELADACHRARSTFHNIFNILGRLLDRRANGRNLDNIWTHLLANLVSRGDIRQKHRRSLGTGARGVHLDGAGEGA